MTKLHDISTQPITFYFQLHHRVKWAPKLCQRFYQQESQWCVEAEFS